MLGNCPGGGTGIRARLKIVSLTGCGFDPHLGHKSNELLKIIRHPSKSAMPEIIDNCNQ